MGNTIQKMTPRNETGFAAPGYQEQGLSPDLVAVLNASPDCVKLIDLQGRIQFMNVNGQCAMQISDVEELLGVQWSTLWPKETQQQIDHAVTLAQMGTSSRFDAFCPTAMGDPRWWNVTVAPIRDDAGHIRQVLSVSRDITPQILREHEFRNNEVELMRTNRDQALQLTEQTERLSTQDKMMREIDHRVRNSLATITSFLNLQAYKAEHAETREALTNASDRVNTIAQIHERLYRQQHLDRIDLGDYIKGLGEQLSSSLGSGNIAFNIDASHDVVPQDVAVSVGLILTEAVGNAIRHGFEPGQAGEITICFKDSGSKRTLLVKDTGRGFPEGFDSAKSSGLGSTIMSLYAMQLGGEIQYSVNQPSGTVFAFIF